MTAREAEHTPPPWRISSNDPCRIVGAYSARAMRHVRIADVNTEANARLIVEAVNEHALNADLLAALEWALGAMAEPIHEWSQYGIEHENARAAIARAKGGKS